MGFFKPNIGWARWPPPSMNFYIVLILKLWREHYISKYFFLNAQNKEQGIRPWVSHKKAMRPNHSR
jgi:hypothetical protein